MAIDRRRNAARDSRASRRLFPDPVAGQETGSANPRNLPPLTLEQVWEWAELHFQRIGRWPTRDSGPIADAPGENWNMVSLAFQRGKRGIPSELTLTKFLAKRWQQSKSGLGQDRRP